MKTKAENFAKRLVLPTIRLTIIVLITQTAYSQPAIQWQHCYGSSNGEFLNNVKQTSDGGYVFVGEVNAGNDGDVSGNHGGDMWVVKTDGSGNLQWQHCLGGSALERGYGISQTADGGYIVCGESRSTDGDVIGVHDTLQVGYSDAWVVKLDTAGNLQWQHCYGGSYGELANDIIQTTDGSYVFVGNTGSNDYDVSGYHGGSDIWLVNLNNAGVIQWQKCLGGTGNDYGYTVKQTPDGGYIIAGSTISIDGDVTGYHPSLQGIDPDAWVVKTDSSGNIQWNMCYGGSQGEAASDIIQTTDGGYLVCGSTNSNDGDVSGYHTNWNNYFDAWAFKISATGVLQWQHCYGGSDNDRFSCLTETADGGYIFAGEAESFDFDVIGNHYDDIWVVKTDTMGNILWQKCLGGSDFEYGRIRIRQTTDNGFIVSGQTYSDDGDVSGNHGMQDCWLVKLAADTILSTENQIPDRMEVQVYPNPAREYVEIKLPSSSDVVLVIKDITGKQVYEQKHYQKKEWRETLHLSPGVYVMQFNFGTKTITQKLMVR